MAITPDRQGLKLLAELNIDNQYSQQYGVQIFNYNGEATDDYKNLCSSIFGSLDDLIAEANDLKSRVPVFNTTKGDKK
jgi:hypothetical protein